MERTKELNIQQLFYAVLNKIWLVVIASLLGGIVMYVYTSQFVTPMYSASVTMYVNNSSKVNGDDVVNYITSSDLATSERLVTTYVSILKSNTVMEKVSEEVRNATGIDVPAARIRGAMSAAAVSETEVFTVRISHSDPKMAAEIANTIALVAPDEIGEIVEGSSTKVIDFAKVPSTPVSPNISQKTMLGVAVGAMLAIALVGLGELLDVRVRGEEDLANMSDAPVLGVIPDFDVEGEKGYTYTAKKSADNSEVAAK